MIASITDPIVQVAVDVVDAMGLPGVFILMVLVVPPAIRLLRARKASRHRVEAQAGGQQ